MVFSMMPKPFADQPGSGMHFHVSLWSGWNPKRPDNAQCLFVPHRSDGSADLDKHAVAAGPTVRRRRAGPFGGADARWPRRRSTPTSGCASGLRARAPAGRRRMWRRARTTARPRVRTLHGRFEWRVPDASANPYLVDRRADRRRPRRHRPQARSRRPSAATTCSSCRRAAPGARHRPLPRSLGDGAGRAGRRRPDLHHAGRDADAAVPGAQARRRLAYEQHVSDWELQRYATAF